LLALVYGEEKTDQSFFYYYYYYAFVIFFYAKYFNYYDEFMTGIWEDWKLHNLLWT